ncbi:polysaccharide deacetylase family protein [Alkalimonas delamerensis]|uniref:Polysaccharide deacetylase family protein n=1 Tax=Alkalimonas delamerensis TaxID=265981 RepID=A0ABT9GMF8_9GAMM|nr:polysaccharide deacetylase family protein [Alkalimonas delamerensis]MDP4528136.1 polysaccharide deacetylase family protein [Alkalimonas delamerensis]
MIRFFQHISQQRSGNRLTILTYHRVAPEGQITYLPALSTEAFSRQLGWIKRYFQVMTLAEAGRRADEGSLPANAAVITVDDGYDDCFHYIFPLLQQHGLTASFFITTAGLQDGQLWEEKIAEAIIDAPQSCQQLSWQDGDHPMGNFAERLQLTKKLIAELKYLPLQEREQRLLRLQQLTGAGQSGRQFLQPEQMRQMAQAGMEFGAHSVHHPILLLEDDQLAYQEVLQSKQQLEALLGQEVVSFAYPNGQYGRDFDDHHIAMVKQAGFRYAVSTNPGSNNDLTKQALCLHRVSPWPTSESRFMLSLLRSTQPQAGAPDGY